MCNGIESVQSVSTCVEIERGQCFKDTSNCSQVMKRYTILVYLNRPQMRIKKTRAKQER